jgi:hypothetical protein
LIINYLVFILTCLITTSLVFSDEVPSEETPLDEIDSEEIRIRKKLLKWMFLYPLWVVVLYASMDILSDCNSGNINLTQVAKFICKVYCETFSKEEDSD